MGLPLSCLEARKETENEAVHSLDHLFGYHQGEALFETGIERESARHLNAMVMSMEATNGERNLVVHSENMITGIIRTKSVNCQVWLRFLNRSQHERRHTAFLYGIPSMTRASANRIEIDI